MRDTERDSGVAISILGQVCYPPAMNKANISFQGSEGLVFSAASRIYAAFLAAGKVTTGQEQHWMDQAIRQAIQLARMTDQMVQSDNELD